MIETKTVTIYKVMEISSAHQLHLPYDSKCNRMHGHNFKIEIWIDGIIDENGMVVDFYKIKKEVMKLDHITLNDLIDNPTAENIAAFLGKKIYSLNPDTISSMKIRVWETSSAFAEIKYG